MEVMAFFSKYRRLMISCAVSCVIGVIFVLGMDRFDFREVEAKVQSDRLSRLFYAYDYERVVAEGLPISRVATDITDRNVARAAWVALSDGRIGRSPGASDRDIKISTALTESPWAAFGTAGSLIYNKQRTADALNYSSIALRKEPTNPDFIWLHAELLRLNEKYDDALKFLDSKKTQVAKSTKLQTVQAAIQLDVARRNGYKAAEFLKAINALKSVAEASDFDVLPTYLVGWYYFDKGDNGDAVTYLAKAARKSNAVKVHYTYWSALEQNLVMTHDQRNEAIMKDIQRISNPSRDSPIILFEASNVLYRIGERAEVSEVRAMLLRRYPDSNEAARVEVASARSLIPTGFTDTIATSIPKSVKDRLKAISISKTYEPYVATEAAKALIDLLRIDKTSSPNEIHQAALTLIRLAPDGRYSYSSAAGLVSEKGEPNMAIDIANEGLQRLPGIVARAEEPTQETRNRYAQSYKALLLDSLGWAQFRSNSAGQAIASLEKGLDSEPNSAKIQKHIAQIYESKGDFPKAEHWYIKCASVPTRLENPCSGSLSALYYTRHGSLVGFDKHLEDLSSLISNERRVRIKHTLLERGDPVNINLNDIHGRPYKGPLDGKVVVVSFWGLWCDICRLQIPKYDQLAKRLNSNDVLFITVNDSKDLDSVRNWSGKRDISTPILDGGEFIRSHDIKSVPTTWFLDRSGRKAMEVIGLTHDMEAEFSSRIEMLKSER